MTGGQLFSVEDYYQAAEQFYKQAVKVREVGLRCNKFLTAVQNACFLSNKYIMLLYLIQKPNSSLDPHLSVQDIRILDLFAQSFGISKLSQILM